MQRQNAYNYDELIACGEGKVFGPGNGRLPLPLMLMFDRITRVIETGATEKPAMPASASEILSSPCIRPDWLAYR